MYNLIPIIPKFYPFAFVYSECWNLMISCLQSYNAGCGESVEEHGYECMKLQTAYYTYIKYCRGWANAYQGDFRIHNAFASADGALPRVIMCIHLLAKQNATSTFLFTRNPFFLTISSMWVVFESPWKLVTVHNKTKYIALLTDPQ